MEGHRESQVDEGMLKSYLPGDATEDERHRVEEAYFSDADLFDRLITAEEDLIDAYIASKLTPHERRLFERSLQTLQRRRVQVTLARKLAARVPHHRAVVEPPATPQTGAPSPVAAMRLMPGLFRSVGDQLPTLTVTGDTSMVRLRLAMSDAEFPQYRAVLRSAGGDERWTQTGLVASPTASRHEVHVDIPATALPPGELVLTLEGASSEPRTVVDDGYYFRVVRD
jgi:hypothetical protein